MDEVERFRDRVDAGRRLGEALARTGLATEQGVLVLALPRGGVPVGAEVARALGAPLDVLVVRKLGVPGQEELAMGAIASGGAVVRNEEVLGAIEVSPAEFEAVVRREAAELARRERTFRGARGPLDARGNVVVLVDDGLATGSTMRAALRALRPQRPKVLVVAVPVASAETCETLREECDGCACLLTPGSFRAVGLWYDDFRQTTDEEVRELLETAWKVEQLPRNEESQASETDVAFEVEGRWVRGVLARPARATGLVVFAHGSGSGRTSPRNRYVAEVLQASGLATLLVDLLELDEAEDRERVFDIPLLADRVLAATTGALAGWRGEAPRVGLFGASTGGGAALRAAALRPELIAAVVSRGGRPDLAWHDLGRVKAPTLLMVGEQDPIVLDLNRRALERLREPSELVVIPGATHLFPEPGALEEVARLAAGWFVRYLAP